MEVECKVFVFLKQSKCIQSKAKQGRGHNIHWERGPSLYSWPKHWLHGSIVLQYINKKTYIRIQIHVLHLDVSVKPGGGAMTPQRVPRLECDKRDPPDMKLWVTRCWLVYAPLHTHLLVWWRTARGLVHLRGEPRLRRRPYNTLMIHVARGRGSSIQVRQHSVSAILSGVSRLPVSTPRLCNTLKIPHTKKTQRIIANFY